MSEHYFLVKYDSTNGWSWDTDLEAHKLGSGTVFINEEWHKTGSLLDTMPEIYQIDEEASSQLTHALLIMNGDN